jgi:hypothetical protein
MKSQMQVLAENSEVRLLPAGFEWIDFNDRANTTLFFLNRAPAVSLERQATAIGGPER